MTRIKPFRASQFKGGYVAEFLPLGQRTWRMVKSGGEPIVFATSRAARDAAENAYLARLEPTIRSTIPVSPERLEAKLMDEAENWLRSNRSDVKNATTHHRPRKPPFKEMKGRARA